MRRRVGFGAVMSEASMPPPAVLGAVAVGRTSRRACPARIESSRGLHDTIRAQSDTGNMFGPGAETGLPVPMAAARRNSAWGAVQ